MLRPAPRHARAAPADRGSASIELVILFPALLLIVTALIQYALWFHARSVAEAAAREGVSAATAYGAAPGGGAQTALAFVAAHGADTLHSPAAAVTTPSTGEVRVVVSGRSLSLIPGVDGLAVQQCASAPVERFVPQRLP
jgi:Flp pilus assembly protein TadG